MGVWIAAGADTDYGTGSLSAAELLAVGGRTGRLSAGFEADLILLEADPLANPAALQDVLMVVTNGRVVMNRLP